MNLDPMGLGWRIDRVPTKPVQRTSDGRISVPLWLRRGGTHHTDLNLNLTRPQAELLQAQLCYLLALDPDAP